MLIDQIHHHNPLFKVIRLERKCRDTYQIIENIF